MKKLIPSLMVALVLATSGMTCINSSQRPTYNTIFSVEQTATLAVDDYFTMVIKGIVTTNGVPAVAKSFNTFQAAAKLAATTSEAGTNALASASLILEASALGNLIQNIELTTKK